MPDLAGLRKQLGLPDDATDDAVIAAVSERLTVKPTEPGTPPAETTPEPAPAATGQALLPENIEELIAARVAAATDPILAELTKVTTVQAARHKADAEATRAQVIKAALDDGKILPAEQALYAEQYDAAPEVVTKLLAAKAKGSAFPVHAAGHTGSPDPTADEAFEAEYAQFVRGGVSRG